jgi:hypothetical protein
MSYQLREAQSKKKGLNPVWRGVGCLIIVAFMIGGYFAAGALLDYYGAGKIPGIPVMPSLLREIQVGPFTVPGSGAVLPISFSFVPAQIMLTLVVMFIAFGLVSLLWGIVNPVKLGPLDAPPIHPKIDKSKVR